MKTRPLKTAGEPWSSALESYRVSTNPDPEAIAQLARRLNTALDDTVTGSPSTPRRAHWAGWRVALLIGGSALLSHGPGPYQALPWPRSEDELLTGTRRWACHYELSPPVKKLETPAPSLSPHANHGQPASATGLHGLAAGWAHRGTNTPEPGTGSRVAASSDPSEPQPTEVALLEAARRSLPSSAQQALALTREHLRLYPEGMMVQEREVLSLEALWALRKVELTRKKARAFLRKYPSSSHRERVQRLYAKTRTQW